MKSTGVNEALYRREVHQGLAGRSDATVNLAGGLAFNLDKKYELALRTLSLMFGEGDYYVGGDQKSAEFLKCVQDCAKSDDPEYVLKLMDYASNEFNLRTTPVVGLIEWINSAAGTVPNTRKYVPRIIRRADMMMRALEYQNARNTIFPRKQAIPNMLTYGISDAIHRFDPFQLAKWDVDKKEAGSVHLCDVLNICHPTPATEEEKEFYARVINSKGNYRADNGPVTFKQALSVNDGESKGQHFTSFMDKMGLQGIVTNINDMLKNGVDRNLIVDRLRSKEAVLKSRMYPFQFMTAYRAVEAKNSGVQTILSALNTAIEFGVENVPELPGTTLVAADNSGSMMGHINDKSTVRRVDIANLFAAMVPKISSEYLIGQFSDEFTLTNLDPQKPVMQNKIQLDNNCRGGCTKGHRIFDYLINNRISVDRVFMFSDMQCYAKDNGCNSVAAAFTEYTQRINPYVRLYTVDVTGNGKAVVPQNDPHVCMLAGFSPKVFEFVKPFETNRNDMIYAIEHYRDSKAE